MSYFLNGKLKKKLVYKKLSQVPPIFGGKKVQNFTVTFINITPI